MLNRQQLNEFARNGILRVSGVVPAADINEMLSLVWDNLERRHPFRRNRPETWRAQRVNGFHAIDKSVTFEKIGNADICQTLDDILGSDNWQRPTRWGSLLIAFPESQQRWELPYGSWHLDLPVSHLLEPLFAVRLFTCLQTLHHGGGATLAVAGSHLLVDSLVRESNNHRYRSAEVRTALIRACPWMNALCSRSDTADRIGRFMDSSTTVQGAELRVIEMTGEPGDIFLVHPLLLHAPSINCSNVPRMVLSGFIYRNGIDPSRLYS